MEESAVGALMLETGESISVRYSIRSIVSGNTIRFVGNLIGLSFEAEHALFGADLILKLKDGRKLNIKIDGESRFQGTGGFF